MSAIHTSGRAPAPGVRADGEAAGWSVWLAAVCGLVFAASVATAAILYAVGADDAIEDNGLGAIFIVVPALGLLGSLVAFVGAIVARHKGGFRATLWLPLLVLPACSLFIIFGETLWWE
jgi:hypothetical protein